MFLAARAGLRWGPIIAAALPDRLLHHSTTVNIRDESYRLKERRKAGLIPQAALSAGRGGGGGAAERRKTQASNR